MDLTNYYYVTTGTIGHFRTEGFLTWEIQSLFRPVQIIGRALTVSCAPTDNSWVGDAVQQALPGDVLIVERQGDLRHACWGGLMSRSASMRGIAGVVIDGAATDWREINELKFPVFCRHLSSLTTRNQRGREALATLSPAEVSPSKQATLFWRMTTVSLLYLPKKQRPYSSVPSSSNSVKSGFGNS